MSTIDRMISGITANIDQSAANNEALHEILSELRIANQRHKRIQEYTAWCCTLAQLILLPIILAAIGFLVWIVSVFQ